MKWLISISFFFTLSCMTSNGEQMTLKSRSGLEMEKRSQMQERFDPCEQNQLTSQPGPFRDSAVFGLNLKRQYSDRFSYYPYRSVECPK